MNEQLKNRLSELKAEYEAGQKALKDLEAKEANIQGTLLRIKGAIQELESQLAEVDTDRSPTQSSDGSAIKRKLPR